jgi:hypothetical protein
LERRPLSIWHFVFQARILVAQRKPQEALGCLAKASAILPMTLDAFVNLIDLYGAVSGDSQLVIPLIQKAKEVLSKNVSSQALEGC